MVDHTATARIQRLVRWLEKFKRCFVKDTGFVAAAGGSRPSSRLLDQYVAAFRHVEAGAPDKGTTTLKDLSTSVASRVTATDRAAITKLLDMQLAKLA